MVDMVKKGESRTVNQHKFLSPRKIGLALCGVGAVDALFFILADVIGVGRNLTMFGYHQLLGATAGLVLIVIGFTVFLFGDKTTE